MGTHFKGTKAETRALDVYIKLRRAVNRLNTRESALMRDAGLTESQFGVLEALDHLGPLCQRELAEKILKSAGNLTTVIDNLERRDLVERRRERTDRRVVTVHLLPAGRDLVGEVMPRNVAMLVEFFSVLKAGEQQEFAAMCRRLGVRD